MGTEQTVTKHVLRVVFMLNILPTSNTLGDETITQKMEHAW